MEKRFIHYSFHWQLRLTRRQDWGGGQKERDGNEKVSWVEQHWQGGATLFRFCLCVHMYCCPSKTQAGINSLQKTKGPFYWKFCLDKIFLPLCSAGFCSLEGSCFGPQSWSHTPTRELTLTGRFSQINSPEDFSLAWFGSDIFNIGSDPSCSQHYLFGCVWIRSNFLQINPFSQGCAEASEAKGGQRSVTGV